MTIRIKGWSKFQHFKDRRPPWVKLYRDLLDDPDWHDLDGDSAKALVMLWLIASEDDDQEGKLPDVRRMAFRLRMTEAKTNQTLAKLSHWLEHDDINAISSRYQVDAPETETETETEGEKETEKKALARPDIVSEQIWSDFLKQRKAVKAPLTKTALDSITREAKKAGWPLEAALVECIHRGWRGFKAEWVDKDKRAQLDFSKMDYGRGTEF